MRQIPLISIGPSGIRGYCQTEIYMYSRPDAEIEDEKWQEMVDAELLEIHLLLDLKLFDLAVEHIKQLERDDKFL